MFDVAYECELNIFISEKIFNEFEYHLIDDIQDFIFAINNWDFYSILFYTHGGI